MTEKWITGGAPDDPGWGTGAAGGIPGVRTGPGCRVVVLADERARVVLVGDAGTVDEHRDELLGAAARGEWTTLTRLPGAYWVLARNGENMFVCGDLAGARAVFYARHGSHVRWSTSIGRLADHLAARVDLPLMGAQIAVGPEHWPERTLYDGIRAVPGGFGLLLGRAGSVRVVDVSDTGVSCSLVEGAAVFGEALRGAVSVRMGSAGGLAGADVSGGLDSSTVAILAARHGEICAVTYRDAYTSAEDLLYARRVAGHIGTTLHIGEGRAGQRPFTWSEGQPSTEQPVAMSLNMPQQRIYLAPAAGRPVHLTGHGGDVVLDSSSAGFIALVQTGRRRAARKEITRWARGHNRSPRTLWQTVAQHAELGHAGALRAAAAAIRTAGPGAFTGPSPVWTWCRPGPFAGWLTPYGRDRVAGLLDEASQHVLDERADVAAQRDALRMVGADVRDSIPLARDWGVRPAHPYLDNRVVRAAFAIDPLERWSTVSFKPLLAAALPELPVWLTGRTSKGSFTRQLIGGMSRRTDLAALVQTSSFVTEGLVDASRALTALSGIAGHHATALHNLQRLVTACHWLAARDRMREGAC
ncbi:asparagine synthase-related protein [Streptomyces jumonjinensis]|nr:asparagine synthase-related protein [Streptomyces jumonjinensis]